MITAHRLGKRYGETAAVHDLSFEIHPGVVTGLLGPNGAGKSTTMRMIVGLDTPTSGSVTVGGRTYRDLPAPIREVGALLDARAMHSGRTARQHLRWIAQAGGVPTSRIDEVLALTGLTEVAGRKVGGFSLGMSQRLGIATALLGDPPVLLFDEPVNGLDPEGIVWVRTMMRRLAAEGRTVVVSSHLMTEMQETADHVLVIGRGRLIADATMASVTGSGNGSERVRVASPDLAGLTAYLRADGGSIVPDRDGGALVTGIGAARIGEIAAMHRIPLHELTPQRASLEAAYLELTRDSVEYRATGNDAGGNGRVQPESLESART